jgi:hypothetical protein
MRTLFSIITVGAMAFAPLLVPAQGRDAYRLAIVSPADGGTVFNNAGDLTVQVSVVPDLAPADNVELLVDGLPAAAPGKTLDFSLTGLVRGPHVLQARIIDSTGNVGSMSASSTVYDWQASALFPNRRVHH